MRNTSLNKVHELAQKDSRVVFIGSDLGVGTLKAMKAEMPERFFMEGVAEQNVIGMAAGMAMDGLIPYVNTIAPFITRRCYEQVAVDVCVHNLPVRLIANGGGVVYAPLGPTHLAIEDFAIMRALPNMAVVAVSDAEEMKRLMDASLDWKGPIYIRLAKGGDPVISQPTDDFKIGKAILRREPGRVLMVSTGATTERCLKAADILAEAGITAGVLHMHTVKPLDCEALKALVPGRDLLVTVEEHLLAGGLGSAILECLVDCGVTLPKVKRLGLPDSFTKEYGSQDSMFETYGLKAEQIATTVRTALA
ncbi:Transketolase C-terminal section [Paramagnetospirillum magnetotacticum MS-1]|uniref:Transketolase C-terminal section n=1 Tax=Paramagnetospirillum magnetotacticum MS-1 TaxID=272627 RepID=A0A0C2YDG1_PARME|nr:transketolase C-terminal domain-containing protein [Paramagnetospirillum magnetotacticum]KIL97749.1 Transketolase C-terminal section [Paramagnetospirillum magnetotacticum MS-1]